jgi:predicted MFS family arabinose efflux permease
VFASNIGNWMQTTLLGAYAYELTESSSFVGLLFWCQLAPQLFLAPTGGVLADTRDRRRLLVGTQLLQLACALALMVEAAVGHPSRLALALPVLGIGVANGIGAPGQSAMLYSLVPRSDVAGAAALQNIQLNLSRVIGPPIGAALDTQLGPAWVFGANATTFAFSLSVIVLVDYPRRGGGVVSGGVLERLTSGFRLARADPAAARLIALLFVFSLFALPFLGLMPVVAEERFGIRPRSVTYGVLLAVFGVGAALGATADGTVLASRPKLGVLRVGLASFGVMLGTWALMRSAAPAIAVGFVVGFTYFLVVTPLSTMFQLRLDDATRGRLMAVWLMAFGGTVPFGALLGGWAVDRTSVAAVLLVGAAVSVALVALTGPTRGRRASPVQRGLEAGRVAEHDPYRAPGGPA